MPKNLKAESDKIQAARKARNAAANAKKKTTTTPKKTTTTAKKKTTTTPKKTTKSNTKSTGGKVSVTSKKNTVKTIQLGVDSVTPEMVVKTLPSFNPNDYGISNPLQPPQNLPQVNELDFESLMSTYQGAIRALKLTGQAFDLTGERYVTEGKKAKAYGAGLDAGIEFEKAKAKLYKYHTQVENTDQAESHYNLAVKRTGVVEKINEYAGTELDENLEKARVKSEAAKLQRQSAESKLSELQKQLGEVAS
ncbi:MAG: hypothetical protein F6J92_03995 [Symploca sp. SIO1A3]|nr:hypothetical protein [Symploca sp. SIO1A3]